MQSADKINKFNLWGRNASKDVTTKRQHKTLAQNANSNGGDASRVGKRCSNYLVEFVCLSFLCPNAGRVAPIRASVL